MHLKLAGDGHIVPLQVLMDMLIRIGRQISIWINDSTSLHVKRHRNFLPGFTVLRSPRDATFNGRTWVAAVGPTWIKTVWNSIHVPSMFGGSTSCLESIPAILWDEQQGTRLSWDPVCHFVYAGLLCKYVRMLHIPHIQASNPCIWQNMSNAWHLLGMLRV